MKQWTKVAKTLLSRVGGPLAGIWLALVAAAPTVGGVTLEWDPSPDAWVAGYAIHYGTAASNYPVRVDVGNATAATITNLTEGTTYYFVATAYTADGQESLPSNEVAYTVPVSQTNQAPQVTAGDYQSIMLPTNAVLSAIVTDDGLPTDPGRASVAWSTVSGPGLVTLSEPTAATTTATFSQPGSYVLRVTAWDGLLASSDEVTVTVAARPLTLAGTIRTYAGLPVPGVTVTLSGDSSQTATTASDGTYAFLVVAGGTYMVTPGKTNDTASNAGLTALDNALIQRDILGLQPLNSPYKLLAADVNGTRSLSALDNALIQRVILGLATNFPASLWRFAPSDHAFADPVTPWTCVSARSCPALASDVEGQDFVAMKMGDVNGTWTPPSGSNLQLKGAPLAVPLTGPAVTFAALPQTVTTGQIVTVPIVVGNFQEVTSAQFSLTWDSTVLEFISVGGFALPGLGAGNFNTANAGRLAMAWADPAGAGCDLEDGAAIFAVQFRVTGRNGTASALAFTDSPTLREVSVEGSLANLDGQAGQVTVMENTPPRCSGIQPASDSSLRLSYVGVPGRTYTVEYCDSLNAPNWLPLGEVTAGDQGRFEYVDTPPAEAAARFYRLTDH